MVNAFLNGLLTFVSKLIEIMLTPLDLLVSGLMPDVTVVLSKVSSFFSLLENYGSFVLSYTGLTHEVIGLVVMLIVAIIYLTFSTLGIKLVLRWYRMLMP